MKICMLLNKKKPENGGTFPGLNKHQFISVFIN